MLIWINCLDAGPRRAARAETLWQQQNGVWTARCQNEPILHCEALSTAKERDQSFSNLTVSYVVYFEGKYARGKAELYGDLPWGATKIFMRQDIGEKSGHQSPLGCEKGTQDPRTCVLNMNIGELRMIAGGVSDTEFTLIWDNIPHTFYFQRDGSPETFGALIEAAGKYLR